MQAAVFLDRDNTLIAGDGDSGDPDQVRLIDGVADGLASLRDAGYRLIVITNQGGVARGAYSEDAVDAVHQRIAGLVEQAAGRNGLIDRFYYCPYHPEATIEEYRRDHPWRKPRPGMILQAARDMNLDLRRSWVIGDQARDVQAGSAAGCRTVFIGDGEQAGAAAPTAAAASFQAAVDLILQNGAAEGRRGETVDERVDSKGRSPLPELAIEQLRRAVQNLGEEFRMERARRAEFTPLKMAAGLVQILTLVTAALGVAQVAQPEAFLKWMAGALLLQLLVIAIILVDQR